MQADNQVYHRGIVQTKDDDTLSILIEDISSCESCISKTSCSLTSKKDKIVTVKNTANEPFAINEKVLLQCNKSLEIKAVLWAYLYPCVLLVASLIFLYHKTRHDVLSFFGSLGVLFIYYFLLYLLKNRFNKKFSFTITKLA